MTGCAGFIGSSLVDRLLADGADVVGIDRFSGYYDPIIKQRNLTQARTSARCHLVTLDLASDDLAVIGEGFDYIFHQAAQAGVRRSWGQEFELYTRDNVLATQRLLEFATELSSLRSFVYASSSSIYGDAEAYPTQESDLPRPVSPNGVTKLAAEHLCQVYAKQFAVPAISLRYFTVYGPRQRPDMAFHRFITAALAGTPVTIYGSGEQIRDFTYIDDIIAANLLAANHAGPGTVYNIGGGHQVSVNEILALLSDLLGQSIHVERVAAQKGDAQRTSADISRAQTIGYSPVTSLRDGLAAELT